jgi:glycosyltransferase involved in cell wall biosynthesis
MRVALVTSSFLPASGRLERRVDQLARGLARRGAEVEILTQGPARSTLPHGEGVIVRCFPTAHGPLRFAVAPKLRERLRLTSDQFDIVDVHTRHTSLPLAVARAGVRRLVFTPGAAIDVFLGWPYTWATRACVASASQIICHSEIDRDLLYATIPEAANRTQVLPDGVDAGALSAARPFVTGGIVVLAVDRLDRATGVGRAIAAMLSLGLEFRLVVIGDGPARDRLVAFAADLRISPRVQFVGAVSDAVLYRWLRTASVVVTLAGERGSGSLLTEGRVAGASVVASDLPIHRQAADRPGGGHVIFVAPKGSPLDVADAIEEAASVSVLSRARGLSFSAPSWESVIESTWALYGQLIAEAPRSVPGRGISDVFGGPARSHSDGEARGVPVAAAETHARAEPSIRAVRWHPRRRTSGRLNGRREWR